MTQLSVVIPVYCSEALVGLMIERTLAVFDLNELEAELILVCDASPDESWSVIKQWSVRDPRVIAFELASNEGQHQAIMVGARHAHGDWLATLDDDLQNPPECLLDLLAVAEQEVDLVFGRFRHKEHAAGRVFASRVVTLLNRLLYGLPRDLVVGNVRLVRRDIVQEVLQHERAQNYFTGLALLAAQHPINASIAHEPRPSGTSSYSVRALVRLFWLVLAGHPRLAWLHRAARPMGERVKRSLNADPRPVS